MDILSQFWLKLNQWVCELVNEQFELENKEQIIQTSFVNQIN